MMAIDGPYWDMGHDGTLRTSIHAIGSARRRGLLVTVLEQTDLHKEVAEYFEFRASSFQRTLFMASLTFEMHVDMKRRHFNVITIIQCYSSPLLVGYLLDTHEAHVWVKVYGLQVCG